jgi:hypothetical protein
MKKFKHLYFIKFMKISSSSKNLIILLNITLANLVFIEIINRSKKIHF